jgi:hypothetical protein
VSAPADPVRRVPGELPWSGQDLAEWSSAITDRAIAAAAEPELKAASLYNRGRLLEKRGDVAGARGAYTGSLALRPNATVQDRLAQRGDGATVPAAVVTGGATPPSVAELKQAHADVRSVPWPQLRYGCGDGCRATVHKVVYGDVEGDGVEEAVVVVQGAVESADDHTANLYGVRAGAVTWLGRVHEGGRLHPEYAPRFVKAVLGGGSVRITWTYQLWGNFDDPADGTETTTETYRIEGDHVVDEDGAPTR